MKLVLVVLDDPRRRSLYNRAFRSDPYRLVFAFDGEDGFDRFFETKPDVIVVYEHVAKLGGSLFISLVRQQPGGATVPVVMLGELPGDADAADARRIAVGSDVLLAHDAELEDIRSTLESLTGAGRTVIAPAPEEPTLPGDEPTEVAERDSETVVSSPNSFYEGPDEPSLELGAGDPRDDGPVLTLDPQELAPRPDPLEEPELVLAARSASSSSLIAEIPRDSTPSNTEASHIRTPSPSERRALDESQLGKRLTKRVHQIFRLLDQVDCYQLFGLERTASLEEIRRAHFELSLEFHPDRFFLLRSGELKTQIYAVYRRLGEAFRTLADPARRRAYDARLGVGDSDWAPVVSEVGDGFSPLVLEVTTSNADASELAARAEVAFREGDLHGARLHLTLARAYDPENSSINRALEQIVSASQPS